MLNLKNINKKLGAFSLSNIDINISKGDYFVLIGKSGSGKSMLLEIITGIITPDSGSILLNGKDIINTPIQKRNIGIVYQKPTLFPHMSVFENIAYPLKIKKLKKEEINNIIQNLAEDTEITNILKRNISNLSGGEIQRVTIARTLATNPEILLLDEPLSFLDVQLRKGMITLLRKLNQKGQTIVHVTHDYEEALALSNKIAIIENGAIIQTGTPKEVFNNPKSEFVANFIGISNFFKGILLKSNDNSKLNIFETSGLQFHTTSDRNINSEGYITIPNEAIIVSNEAINSNSVNNFHGTIKDIYPTKSGIEIVINIGIELTANITQYSFDNLNIEIGKKIWVSVKASSIKFIRG
ncbi:MAG: ABC transporter ATP-binding protein [Bacteroidia bacterium]|nr:ABC transporter ATP-binding protein [Bacteroidia bacterium]